jgi:hypothetical protein
MGNWRIGQDWSTFQNTAAIPESASFLALSDGMVFVRQAQIRYTNGNFQASLENTDTTVTPFGGGGRIESGDGAMPDLVARYNLRGDGVNVAFAGIARRLSAEVGGIDGDAFGWGVSVQGRVSLTDTSDLRFSLTAGEGVGRYIGLNAINGAVADRQRRSGSHPGLWRSDRLASGAGRNRRFNVGYSYLEADNDVSPDRHGRHALGPVRLCGAADHPAWRRDPRRRSHDRQSRAGERHLRHDQPHHPVNEVRILTPAGSLRCDDWRRSVSTPTI